MHRVRWIVSGLLAGVWLANSASFGGPRISAPGESQQQVALALIQEVYAEKIAGAKSNAEKRALARQCYYDARQTVNDPVGRFVLLEFAGDMAAEAGDVATATAAYKYVVEWYEVDELAQWTRLVSRFKERSAQRTLAVHIAGRVDDAVDDDDYSRADALALLAVAVARKSGDTRLVTQVTDRQHAVRSTAKAFALAEKALDKLEDSPADPDANLTVGKYQCLIKGDWQFGLSSLALGSDPVLQKLAVQEISDATHDPTQQVALADGWWDLAEGSTFGDDAQYQLQLRAAYWYRQALPQITGLSKALAEKRLESIYAARSSDARNSTVAAAASLAFGSTATSPAADQSECSRCKGRKVVDCPVRGCALGRVKVPRYKVMGRDPASGTAITWRTTVRVPCSACNGRGKLPCPQCQAH